MSYEYYKVLLPVSLTPRFIAWICRKLPWVLSRRAELYKSVFKSQPKQTFYAHKRTHLYKDNKCIPLFKCCYLQIWFFKNLHSRFLIYKNIPSCLRWLGMVYAYMLSIFLWPKTQCKIIPRPLGRLGFWFKTFIYE